MDSQTTLVDPVIYQRSLAHTVLRFQDDSVHNTVLIPTGSSIPSYIVESNRHASQTKITRVEGARSTVVGLIKRRGILPDEVTLEDRRSTRIVSWLSGNLFAAVYVPQGLP